MGQDLCLVDREHMLDRFEFQQDRLQHDAVGEVAAVHVHGLVSDWPRSLAFELEAGEMQFPAKALVVNGLEQAGTNRAVDFDRKTDDVVGEG